MLLLILLATHLTVAPPPAEPGVLRDVVWPVLTASLAGEAGLLWATEPAPGLIRLHRVLYQTEREVTADVAIPAGEPVAAQAEAIRLRLAWLLEAPPDAGTPWTPPDLPPPPAPPLLSPERADNLRTQRPALPPRRRTMVPLPPGVGPDPAENGHSVEQRGPTEAEPTGRLMLRLGPEMLADLDGISPGFAIAGTLRLDESWRLGGLVAGHPFHDFVKENRALGVSNLLAMVQVGWTLWQQESVTFRLTGGVFHASLWGAGRGVTTGGARLGGVLGGALDVALSGPLSLALDVDVLASIGRSEARYGDDVLMTQGPVELRTALMVGWAIW